MIQPSPVRALVLLSLLLLPSLALSAQAGGQQEGGQQEGGKDPVEGQEQEQEQEQPAQRPRQGEREVEVRPGELIDLATREPKAIQGPVLELALEDALRLALEQNLDLEIARLATERSEYQARGSWGAFDPVYALRGSLTDAEVPLGSQAQQGFRVSSSVLSIDTQALNTSLTFPVHTGGSLSVSYDRSNTDNSDNILTSDTLSFNLFQPLLRGAWSRYATADQRQAEIAHERQMQNERRALQAMLRDVYVAYWNLVSAREQLRVREQAVSLGLNQLEQDERRLEVGAGTEVDVLQSQTNVAQQEEQRIQAQFELRAAEDALRGLIFQQVEEEETREYLTEWDWPIVPRTELPTGEPEEAELSWLGSLDQAIRHRPELWQARLDIDAAEVSLERAYSERLPQLDLGLNLDSQGENIDPNEAFQQAFDFDLLSARASLDFSVPVWNRTRAYAVRAARSDVRSSRLAYDRLELDVLAEVRRAVRDLVFSVESVSAASTSFRLARRQFEAEQARRDIGLSTTFQVLQFQQDLVEARSAEVTARANWMKSRAGLRFAEGRLTENPDELEGAGPPETP